MLKRLAGCCLITLSIHAAAFAQVGQPAPAADLIGQPAPDAGTGQIALPPQTGSTASIGVPAPSDQSTHIGLPTPSTKPTHLALKPTDIDGVNNFSRVSSTLFRGEQPSAAGFASLKKLGVKTVVCLRTFHTDTRLLQGTGLQYVNINSQAWHPEDEDLVTFLKIVGDPANQPVFVHCMQGADRTGYMVAAYRMIEEGWTFDEAEAEMRNFSFHEVWRGIPTYLKKLDAESIRKQVEKAQPVAVITIGGDSSESTHRFVTVHGRR